MANFNGGGLPDAFAGDSDADTANGNGGNDTLAGGGGSDVLDGGDDDDKLYSAQESPVFYLPHYDLPHTPPVVDTGAEVDTLRGGAGDDRIFAGYGDNIDGGPNSGIGDYLYISFLGAPSGVTVDFRLISQVVGGGTIQNIENISWVQGSNFNDDINVMTWREGSTDFTAVYGMGGDDTLVAAYKTGRLDGGEGDDTLDARASYYLQFAEGGAGADLIYMNPHATGTARGGAGNDTIYSNWHTYGGAGDDTIVQQASYYLGVLYGEEGNDDITGVGTSHGGSIISGGGGGDTLRGGTSNDILVSGNFSPTTYTAAPDMGLERDFLTGAAGDDTLFIGYGDYADGGEGADILHLSLGGLFSVTFSTAGIVSGQPFVLGGGTIENIETLASLLGTAWGDYLTLATQATLLTVDAGDGNDTIVATGSAVAVFGGAGDDVFYSGTAADRFDGGTGIDLADYGSAGAGVVVTLAEYWAIGTGGGGDELTNIENANGSGYADTLTGNSHSNVLGGGGGDDILYGLAGNDTLDGGFGADRMEGGANDDTYIVDDVGDLVVEAANGGTDSIRIPFASYSLVGTNIENLIASSDIAHDFRGNAGNNVLVGGAGNDVFRLYDGGIDRVFAGAGNDIIFMGASLDLDEVFGEAGIDTLVLSGGHFGLTLSTGIALIENISLLSGSNTSFGDSGTNRYDWVLTTRDQNFEAGVQARINGAALLAGEDFTFNGSAETNASFVVYGGKGVDTLTGGLGNDIFFYAEERFASGDTVNGGAGYDGMFLRGNYTIDFNAPGYTGLFTNIENLTLTSVTDERYARGGGTEFDYNLTLSNAIVKAGETLTISGTILTASETMVVDASQELNGMLRLFGGKAADTLKGGGQNDLLHGNLGADTLAGNGGADAFRFQDTAESNSATMDQILDFTPGTDRIELDRIDANTLTAGDQGFSWIGSNAFSGTAGELRAYEQGGSWFVEGDTNGDGAADLVIALTLQGAVPLGATDFLL